MGGASQAARRPKRETGAVKKQSFLVWFGALLCLFAACDRDKGTAQAKGQNAPAIAPAEEHPKLSFPPDSGPPPAFDGNRAMKYVKEIVAFGPRPLGSANHKKGEDYITSHLKGDV